MSGELSSFAVWLVCTLLGTAIGTALGVWLAFRCEDWWWDVRAALRGWWQALTGRPRP